MSDGNPDTSLVVHPLVQQGLLYEAWDQAPALVFVADENMRYIAVAPLARLSATRETNCSA